MARSLPVPVRRTLVLLATLVGLVLSTAASCDATGAPNAAASTGGSTGRCSTSTRNSHDDSGGTTRTVYQKCTYYTSRTTTSTPTKTRTTKTSSKDKNSSGKHKHSDDDDDDDN
jgi:hypothetical protein